MMAGTAPENSRPTIPATGLTVIFEPEQSSLDIVFVHGFKGHPERTWSHKAGEAQTRNENAETRHDEPPSKYRKLNRLSRHPRTDPSESTVFWPRDLVPTVVPNARILSYGYDTKIQHWSGPPVSTHTVYDIAWDFLVALEAERRAVPSRSMVFIAHSLGGIVGKEMLRRSSTCQSVQAHLAQICSSTSGLMFFGTPHAGADPRGLFLSVAEMVYRAVGYSPPQQIIDALLPSAERLRELRDSFGSIALESNWTVHSFQEQYKVTLLGRKIVEDASSYLNIPSIEITEHIGRDHTGMSRFTGLDDPEFKKVAAALRRITGSIQHSSTENVPLDSNKFDMLLESLKFEQIDTRHASIKKAHTKTCKWLLQQDEWLKWLDPTQVDNHHGFLWIKGNPGTGKSTIMKFALENSRKAMKGKIILNFFFHARGTDMEKSTQGMYQSLLLQLLTQRPQLRAVLGSFSTKPDATWNIESLKSILEYAVLSLQQLSVAFFIDALDECDEAEIRDMVSFLEQLGDAALSQGVILFVCFSSRHYPYITVRHGLELVLEGQEGHASDITTYVDCELNIGHSKLAEQIRQELQEKASGVFMWVVLVVGMLNIEYDKGRIHTLRRRLHEIPGDLHALFRNILTRDGHDKEELLLCMQWLMYSKTPLGPEEFYYALLSGVAPEALSAWEQDQISIRDMNRFIINCSKGLAETTRSKSPKVQFIHESVRDFLLKEDGLADIFPSMKKDIPRQSHIRLAHCCQNYISLNICTYVGLEDPPPKASSPEAGKVRQSALNAFPFLKYAIRNVLYHFNAGDSYPTNFPLTAWIKLDNMIQIYSLRQHSKQATFLYILAEHDAANLIQSHASILSCIDEEDERYSTPITAALVTKSNAAFDVFCESLISSLPTPDKEKINWRRVFREWKNRTVGRDYPFKTEGLSALGNAGGQVLLALILRFKQCLKPDAMTETPLRLASNAPFGLAMSVLVETSGETREAGDILWREPSILEIAMQERLAPLISAFTSHRLSGSLEMKSGWLENLVYAVRHGFELISITLLETGQFHPCKSYRDLHWRTPLCIAAAIGNISLVRLMLEKFPASPTFEIPYGYAVSEAARHGYASIVGLLLEASQAEPSLRDQFGRRALCQASIRGHEPMVRLLLGIGNSDLELEDGCEQTRAASTVDQGHSGPVCHSSNWNPLDIDAKDYGWRTALSYAAESGRTSIVKLLLQTGRVDPDSKDRSGRTPLSYAAERGHATIVKLLLDTRLVDPELVDEDGRTPVAYALRKRHAAILELLEAY